MKGALFGDIEFPNDSGPIYLETLEGRFPIEPYNTFSNLIFLAILIYWGLKVYKDPKRHLFLAWVFPVIFISYIGGTVYHATRSAEIWLLMDWVPIMLLCMAVVVYFIFRITSTRWQRALVLVVVFGCSFGLRTLPMPPGLRISLGYVIMALTILVPLIWYLALTHWKNVGLVILAFAIFGVAICFRSIDLQQQIMPMGTHWLWHFFGGVAVHVLIAYIFRDNSLNLPPHKAVSHD